MREHCYEDLATYLKGNCNVIQHLNLKGIWLTGKSRLIFCDALRRMPQLRYLNVPHIASSQMIETLSRKCAHLTYLDLSGSQELTEDDLLKLSSLRTTLKILNLANVGRDPIVAECVATLINNLPNLISLGGYQKTGEAIRILNMDLGRTHITKLKFIHDSFTEFQSINSIRILCPG